MSVLLFLIVFFFSLMLYQSVIYLPIDIIKLSHLPIWLIWLFVLGCLAWCIGE
jgi:hypothetical protein